MVEYLLNMLLHTSGSYKELVDKESRLAADLALAQAQLFPLKKENSRLTRENHQLHVDNIRQTDAAANLFSEQTVAMKKLQDDMVELNHVVKLKEEQYKRLEAEKERIREAYEDLADPAIKSKNVRRVMKMSAPLPKSSRAGAIPTSSAVPDGPPVDANVIDSLRRQLDESHAAIRKNEEDIKRLQNSVNARETELARSSHTTDIHDANSGKTEQLFAADAANKRIIDQLNGQVDFLNEQLALREAQLVETADKIIRADELQVELNQKNYLFEKARTQNSELAGQLRAMENKVAELTEAVDPEGSVSVDDLFEISSQNDSRSYRDLLPVAPSPSESRAAMNRDAVGTRRGVSTRQRDSKDASSDMLQPRYLRSDGRDPDVVRASTSSSITATLRKAKVGAKDVTRSSNQENIHRDAARNANLSERSLEAAGSDGMVLKLAAEKSGLLGEVSRLSDTLHDLQSGDALVKERMRRGEEKLAAMRHELEDTKKQAEMLARSLGQKEEELKNLRSDYEQSQCSLNEAVSRISNSASSAVELQSRADQTRGILSDALREKEQYEKMIEALKAELSKLRKDHIELVTGRETAEVRLRVIDKEIAQARQTADKAILDLTASRAEVVRLGLQTDSLDSELQISRRKVETEKRASLDAQESLATKTSELSEATQRLTLLQMSAAPSAANDQLRSDIKMLRGKCEDLETEKRSLLQDKRSLEQSLQSIASQQQTHSQRTASVESDRSQLTTDLARKENDLLSVRRESQRLELELEQTKALLVASEKTCIALRSAVTDREAHLTTRGETSDQLNSEVQLMSRRLQDAQESYAMIRRQLDDSNDALLRTTDRCTNAEREVASLTELLSANQRDCQKAEMQLDNLQRQLDMTAKRANVERDEVRRAAVEKDALEAKIQELKALIANMEGTTRSHTLKSTRLAAALEEGGEGMRRMETDMQNLRDSIADKDRRLAQTQDALQRLDQDRDRLQLQLDAEQEQSAVKDQSRQHLDSQMMQLRQVLDRTEKKLAAVGNDLTATQRQCAATEARLTSLKEENTELRRRINQKTAEVGGAAEDLMLMTKENQALTAQLAETASERDRLRNRTAEVAQALATVEQARRAVEIERADLLESYRSVLNEKRKLENDLNAMG